MEMESKKEMERNLERNKLKSDTGKLKVKPKTEREQQKREGGTGGEYRTGEKTRMGEKHGKLMFCLELY